jgi:hypothetical protein
VDKSGKDSDFMHGIGHIDPRRIVGPLCSATSNSACIAANGPFTPVFCDLRSRECAGETANGSHARRLKR